MLSIRVSWLLNGVSHVNLNIKLYLYFKSHRNTCYLPCYYFLPIHIGCVRVCVYVGSCGHARVWVRLAVVCMCGSQRTTCRGRFSPCSMWVPDIELSSSGLTSSAFTRSRQAFSSYSSREHLPSGEVLVQVR